MTLGVTTIGIRQSAAVAALVAMLASGCASDGGSGETGTDDTTTVASEPAPTPAATIATVDLELVVPAGPDLRRRTLSLEDRFVHSGFDHVTGVLAVSISETVPVDDSPLCAIAVDPADAARFSPADQLPDRVDVGEALMTEPTAKRFDVEPGDTISAWATLWTLGEFVTTGALTDRCDVIVSIATELPDDAVGALLIDLDDGLAPAERETVITEINEWSTEQ